EVGERRVLVEVAVEGLALAERALRTQAADLGAGPRREDAHDREPARPVPHGLVVADREVAHDDARRIDQRHPAVAVDAPVAEGAVRREELLQPLREVRHLPVQHALAGVPASGTSMLGRKAPRPQSARVRKRLRSSDSSETKAYCAPRAEARCRTSDAKNWSPVSDSTPSTIARRAASSGSGCLSCWSLTWPRSPPDTISRPRPSRAEARSGGGPKGGGPKR